MSKPRTLFVLDGKFLTLARYDQGSTDFSTTADENVMQDAGYSAVMQISVQETALGPIMAADEVI